MNKEKLGIKQLADRMCCSQQSIYDRIEHGLPRQADGKFSWSAVWEWWNQHLLAKSVATTHDHTAFAAAELRLMEANAKFKELKTRQLSGELVEVSYVLRSESVIYQNLRNRILAVPAKLTPQLVGVSSLAKVRTILDKEIAQLCNELAQIAMKTPDAEQDEQLVSR